MENDVELEKLKLSAWNTAHGVTNRLNTLLDTTLLCASQLKIYDWFMILKQIDKELDCRMSNDQRKNIKKLFEETHNMIHGHYTINKTPKSTHSILYDNLDKIEKELRRIANEQGLLVPSKNDSFEEWDD